MRALERSVPEIRLYRRDGCGLCDETQAILESLLARRADTGGPAVALVEIDIATDPELERSLFTVIPVVEVGGRRLELATSAAKLRRLLAEGLDESSPPAPRASAAIDPAAAVPTRR